jgi:hypothetical protein
MYLRTDEEAESANAVKMAAQFAECAHKDPQIWRWIVIALHNAVQGTMVLSLRHGNGLLVLSDDCYAAWIKAYENNEPPPPEKLDSYLNLYKKVKQSQWGIAAGNRRFVPSGSEGKDIKHLNSLRNDFIHFTPKGWSLEIDGLPRICLSAARLIFYLGIETNNVYWHCESSRSLLEQSLASFSQSMMTLHAGYAASAA